MSLKSNSKFVRLFLGRLITNAGDSAYLIGAMWLVHSLTGSPFYTGLAGFLVRLPRGVRFLVGPLVDRWEPRPVLVVAQLVQGVLVLVVPIAIALGRLSLWVVLLVLPIVAFIDQFVSPAEKTALPRIVDDDRLVRANSLISFAESGTDVAFTAASGLLLSIVTANALFVIDSATFFIAGGLFVGITLSTAESSTSKSSRESSYFGELRQGFDYLRGSVIVLVTVGAMGANFGAGSMMAILPQLGDSLGGPAMYGLLMSAIAAGGVVGAGTASLVEDRPYGLLAVVAFLSAGTSLSLATAISEPVVIAVFLFVTFVPIGIFNVLFFSLLQSSVERALLGRVSSIASSLTAITFPVGSLVGGIVAEQFGLNVVLYIFSGLLVTLGVVCFVHPRIRSLPAIGEIDEEMLGLGT